MEMTDKEFEKRSRELVKQYADIVKNGFPEKELDKWNEKVDKLPPVARGTVRSFVEMDDILKEALMGREERSPGRR